MDHRSDPGVPVPRIFVRSELAVSIALIVEESHARPGSDIGQPLDVNAAGAVVAAAD